MSALRGTANTYLDVAQLPAMTLCMHKLEDLVQAAFQVYDIPRAHLRG